jgi:hypothetical protein
LQKILVEIANNLGRLMMIISFNSLKVIIFFDLISCFFKKAAKQTYLSRFLSYKEKFVVQQNRRHLIEVAGCPAS